MLDDNHSVFLVMIQLLLFIALVVSRCNLLFISTGLKHNYFGMYFKIAVNTNSGIAGYCNFHVLLIHTLWKICPQFVSVY